VQLAVKSTLPVLLYPGLLRGMLAIPLANEIVLGGVTTCVAPDHVPLTACQFEKITSAVEKLLELSSELKAQ